jgi:hypothetical protein
MLAQPPRMLWYGWRRARKEQGRVTKSRNDDVEGDVALNPRVPALQELLNTPLTTFPPMHGELWAKLSSPISDSPTASVSIGAAATAGTSGDAAVAGTTSSIAADTTAAAAASGSAVNGMVAAVDAARASNDRCAIETVTAPRA